MTCRQPSSVREALQLWLQARHSVCGVLHARHRLFNASVVHVLTGGGTGMHCKGEKPPPLPFVHVRSPCRENDPADAHPRAHKSVLESANPGMDSECASGCPWSTARATARLWDSRPTE